MKFRACTLQGLTVFCCQQNILRGFEKVNKFEIQVTFAVHR